MTLGINRNIALVGLFIAAVLIAIIVAQAIGRPPWIDETMAMRNYPLQDFRAFFEPLPFYSQAAPPLFNLLMTAMVSWPPEAIRISLLTLIGLGSLAVVAVNFRNSGAVLGAALALVAMKHALHQITEIKYYGFEIFGTVLILVWLLGRRPQRRLGLRDLMILAAGVLSGISTLVIAVLALGYVGLARLSARQRIAFPEIVGSCLFLLFTVAYYIAIRHAVSIQLDTYFDIYQLNGASAALNFLIVAASFGSPYFIPLALFAVALSLRDWRNPVSRDLLLFSTIIFTVFSALAFVGLFPASAARHVTWVGGFGLVLVANAGRILMSNLPATRSATVQQVGIAAVFMLLALLPAVNLIRGWNREFPGTDNAAAVRELLNRPEYDVGLWIGGQPAIEYYRRFLPQLDRRRYFGLLNVTSAPLPTEMRSPAYLQRPFAEIAADIQSRVDQPGAWGRAIIYRILLNFTAQMASLFDAAPRGQGFLLFASAVGDCRSATAPSSGPIDVHLSRCMALWQALADRHCSVDEVWRGNSAFILRAYCDGDTHIDANSN